MLKHFLNFLLIFRRYSVLVPDFVNVLPLTRFEHNFRLDNPLNIKPR